MKKLLVMMTVLAMCATSAICAEVAPKKKGPSAKAYERASDKAKFKRNFESKDKKPKKEVEAQKAPSKEEKQTKSKKKGFLWW
jgi:hypothetical protein